MGGGRGEKYRGRLPGGDGRAGLPIEEGIPLLDLEEDHERRRRYEGAGRGSEEGEEEKGILRMLVQSV